MFNCKKLAVYSLLAVTFTVQAKTTVIAVESQDFPHDRLTRIYVDQESLFLECRDEYLTSTDQVIYSDEIDKFIAGLTKLHEWMELNKTVKADVTKPVPTDMRMLNLAFIGKESGASLGIASIKNGGTSCYWSSVDVAEIIDAMKNNLAKAREEDAKNKADLFD